MYGTVPTYNRGSWSALLEVRQQVWRAG